MTVNVRSERNALFFDVAQLCKRKNLESAAVGQDRPVPACEFMQTAEPFYIFVTRAQVQMICVAKLNLTLDLLKIKCLHRAFDRAARCNIHERRSLYRSVNSMKLTAPRAAAFF